MRLFQNSGVYRSYRPRLARLTHGCATFASATQAFLNDRFGAAHVLRPVLDGSPEAFFANGDEEHTQRLWAREHGMPASAPLDAILLAQIEEHRTEVFYNLDPMLYGDEFLRHLPSSIKRTVAWRAAPSAGGRFLTHDVIVNNFPSLLEAYRKQGTRAEYMFPAHDPEMDAYQSNRERPIDVLFVGGYSRHHLARARMLTALAELRRDHRIELRLDPSRLTWLAETPLGWIGPLRQHRRPEAIRALSSGPVFGRALLDLIGQAKIVVNGAIDMAGQDRGNLRIWEALGCGAALVSDSGRYPDELIPGEAFASYDEPAMVAPLVNMLLADDATRWSFAKRGGEVVRTAYSKSRQWARFVEIVA